jgi:serine/threonine-protein kinase
VIAVGSIVGGRLRVDQILGGGGMGTVVGATHLELGHRVAIKFLHDGLAQNAEIVERFLREARSVVALRTEHVCRVIDVSRLDSGAPYIVMEMLDGSDLQQVVAQHPLPPTAAVEYVLQACIGLAEAHQAGIIHRDLKPANLFVTRRSDGAPLIKVLDFGIAKAIVANSAAQLTGDGLMGSPGYMSPEQINSAREVDVRSDIWSLGVTLYQLLSARMPFEGQTIAGIAVKIATAAPDPIETDPHLRAIIWRCLEKERARRYANVAELAHDLAPFAGPAGHALAAQVTQILMKSSGQLSAQMGVGMMSTAAGTGIPMQGPAASPKMTPLPTGTGHPGAASSAGTLRSKLLIVIGSLLALGGVGIGIMVASNSGKEPAQQIASVTPPPSPPPAIDAPNTNVEPSPKPTRDPAVAAKDRTAKPQPTPADDKPKPAAKAKPVSPKPTPSPKRDTSDANPVWAGACARADGRLARFAPPGLITKCMCLKGDRSAAQEAYLRIEPEDRKTPRETCLKYGIRLHE